MRGALRLAAMTALVLIVMPRALTADDHQAAIKDATASAVAWLALVDAGNYGASYDSAAALLQQGITKEQFTQKVAAARQPLGKVLSRVLKMARFMTSLPGAPDGAYVVLKYDTSFENKKIGTETIAPMLEKDGAWRVSGYYIQ
jgi:Protein of unknown function (DUF4019)